MTQLEFDKTMAELRIEHEEKKDKIKAEIKESQERVKKLNDTILKFRQFLHTEKEIQFQHQEDIRKENCAYKQKKNALITAFPEAYGTRSEDNCRKRHEPYAVRAMMIATLKEQLKDCPGIDVENINVHFTIEGDAVTYQAILPKKND